MFSEKVFILTSPLKTTFVESSRTSLSKSTLANSTVNYQSSSSSVSQHHLTRAILPSFEILFTCPFWIPHSPGFLFFCLLYIWTFLHYPASKYRSVPGFNFLLHVTLTSFMALNSTYTLITSKTSLVLTPPLNYKLTNLTTYGTASLRFQIKFNLSQTEIMHCAPIFPHLCSLAQSILLLVT